MGPVRLALVWIGLGLAACSASPFNAFEPAQLSGLKRFDLVRIEPDMLVRCRMRLKSPEKTESGDCRLWIGSDRLRFEASHSLAGLLVHLEARPEGVRLIDGQSGRRRELKREDLNYPLLDLPPEQLKALILGRDGSGNRPDGFQRARQGQFVEGRYKFWTWSQGVPHPKVIEVTQGDWELKLVILDLQLGRGEALQLPQ